MWCFMMTCFALVHLAAEGVTTMTTEADPATELEAVPGIDEALVEAFEEEVEAAAPAKPSATATITEADSAAGPAAGPAVVGAGLLPKLGATPSASAPPK